MTIAFTLRDYELEDIANAFRELGVEALAVNGHRIVARTVIQENGGRLSLDGAFVNAPYVFDAIGDPAALYGSSASGVSGEQAGPVGAETIAATLRSRGNVSLTPEPDLHINAVVPVHPQVYASYSPH